MNDLSTKQLWRITPRPELVQLLRAAGASEIDELSLADIWSAGGARLSSWSTEQEAARVKILHLILVRRGYGHLNVLQDALEFPRIDISNFDKFWVLENLRGVDEDADELLRLLAPSEFAEVVPTEDMGVNEWLRKLSAAKRDPT